MSYSRIKEIKFCCRHGFSFFRFESSKGRDLLIFFILADDDSKRHCSKRILLRYFSFLFLSWASLSKNQTKSPCFSRCPSARYTRIYHQEACFRWVSVRSQSMKRILPTHIHPLLLQLPLLKIYLPFRMIFLNVKPLFPHFHS